MLASVAVPALADTPKPKAAHHKASHHDRHAATRHASLVPPAPPKAPAAEASNSAPIPNESVTAPPDRNDQNTSVAPAVMQIHYPPMGDGYTTGSSAQAMDDREAAKVTGVQVKVPLGQ
jgi:hypothetical protein